MEFLRQEYWSGLPCPPAGDLPGVDPVSLTSPALAGGFFTKEPLEAPLTRLGIQHSVRTGATSPTWMLSSFCLFPDTWTRPLFWVEHYLTLDGSRNLTMGHLPQLCQCGCLFAPLFGLWYLQLSATNKLHWYIYTTGHLYTTTHMPSLPPCHCPHPHMVWHAVPCHCNLSSPKP